jgi:hypothetical protein
MCQPISGDSHLDLAEMNAADAKATSRRFEQRGLFDTSMRMQRQTLCSSQEKIDDPLTSALLDSL